MVNVTVAHVAQADAAMNAHVRAASYGAHQTNPLSAEDIAAREAINYGRPVNLANKDLVKITRLRLLTDPGFPFYDISYCYGEMRDGTPVLVNLGDGQLRKGHGGFKAHLIELARAAGRYAKGMGLIDDSVISIMR